MALDFRKSAGNASAEGYVKTPELRDFPVVAIRPIQFSEGPNFQKDGMEDRVIADFVALDDQNNVVFAKRSAKWGINRRKDPKTGVVGPGILFEIFDTTTTGYVIVGSVYMPDGKRYNTWADIEPSEAQAAALEKGFANLGAAQNTATNPAPTNADPETPWGNSQVDDTPPF